MIRNFGKRIGSEGRAGRASAGSGPGLGRWTGRGSRPFLVARVGSGIRGTPSLLPSPAPVPRHFRLPNSGVRGGNPGDVLFVPACRRVWRHAYACVFYLLLHVGSSKHPARGWRARMCCVLACSHASAAGYTRGGRFFPGDLLLPHPGAAVVGVGNQRGLGLPGGCLDGPVPPQFFPTAFAGDHEPSSDRRSVPSVDRAGCAGGGRPLPSLFIRFDQRLAADSELARTWGIRLSN